MGRVAIVFLSVLAAASACMAGLIGYYPFEGNANDASGSGNHGVFSAVAPSLTASGYLGQAYQFGASGQNTYITVPININPGVMPQVTFGAWVNADVANAIIRGVISHDDGGFDRTIDVDTRGGGVKWCAFTGSTVTCGDAVAAGAWTFVAVRYDDVTNDIALTVNGSTFLATGSPGSGLTSTTIGRNPLHDSPFIGLIDEVFIFDEFLTDQQLDTIRLSGVQVNPGIPEPATFLLVGLGLAAAGLLRCRVR